jgi:serine protease Do
VTKAIITAALSVALFVAAACDAPPPPESAEPTVTTDSSVLVLQAEPFAAEQAMAAAGAETVADFRQVVQDAKAKVFPAVVFIKVLQETHTAGERITSEIVGSGVLISATGEVVTNWHVVDKAIEINCLLYDGRHMAAEVIGKDKDTDLALIQLDLPDDASAMPFATMGDSDVLKEGDFVMAMGAPWGMSRSVSIGIISCRDRYLPENSEYSLWLQTDASISPGNSGGPLVDTQGAIVGINTRGRIYGGDTGFAVPVNTVRLITDRLREHGDVNWSWAGLQLQPLQDFKRDIYFEGDQGVIVASTDPESPARREGFKGRDRILTINGQPVTAKFEEGLPAIRRIIALLPKLEEATFTVQRGDETLTLTLIPREKGQVEGEELDCPRWNMTVKQINQFDNPELYFHRTEGVFIYGIKRPGNALNAGLERQDILLKIDGQEVTTLEEVKAAYDEAIANIDTKHRIVLDVLRNGLMRRVVLDFSRDYERE